MALTGRVTMRLAIGSRESSPKTAFFTAKRLTTAARVGKFESPLLTPDSRF